MSEAPPSRRAPSLRAIGSAYRAAFSGLPRPVWLLALAQLVNRSGTMVLPFLVLWLIEERGFTVAEAGRAVGFYGGGAIAGAFLGGMLVDRLTARTVMVASLALAGVGFLVLGALESRGAILVALPALGVVAEALRPAASSALAQAAAPGERVRAFALARLAVNLGMTLGPTLGGVLATWSYRSLFVVDGATSLAAAGLVWKLFRAPPAAKSAIDDASGSRSRSPWSDLPYVAFLVLMTLFAMVIFQISSAYPLFIHRDLGHSELRLGLLLGTNTALIVLFEMLLVHRLRGLSPLGLVGPGAFLFCAGFALMPLSSSFTWLVLTVLVWTAGEMLALPLVESIVADRADERSRGRYLGMLTLSFSLAFMLAPIVGTWVYERMGAPTLWYGCGVTGAALWLGFAALRRPLSRRAA